MCYNNEKELGEMKIAFLGDSITEGKPGVSYFDILKQELDEHDLSNLGKGGDTVKSLYRRIKKIDLSTYDCIVLFIGINDVFGKLNRSHKIVRILQNQVSSKNKDTFILEYKELLDHLLTYEKKIIVIPPLLLGEDLSNEWNEMVRELEVEIELLVRTYNLPYLDVQRKMYDYLEDKEQSSFLPSDLRLIAKDLVSCTSSELVDHKAQERGLIFTLDGVHLNSKGASFVANAIIKELNKE